jgi:hypothetical protein
MLVAKHRIYNVPVVGRAAPDAAVGNRSQGVELAGKSRDRGRTANEHVSRPPDGEIQQINPRTNKPGATLDVGAEKESLGFAFGSLWAADDRTSIVTQIHRNERNPLDAWGSSDRDPPDGRRY